MQKMTGGFRAFNIFNILFFLVVAVTMVFPFINVITLSLQPEYISSRTDIIHLFPKEFTVVAYKYIWEHGMIKTAFFNSVFITLVGSFLGVIVSGMFSYGISAPNVPGRKFFSFLVVFTMMFSGGMIPLYMVVKNLGLINSLWSLILPTLLTGYNIILMKAFFQNLPLSLMESAKIDGCNEIVIFFRIVIPLSKPILATILLFYGVRQWNMFFDAVLYITDRNKIPLQLLLREILIQVQVSASEDILNVGENVKMATAVVAIVPILFIYPSLQRYFTKGIMLGAVKG